MAKEWKLIEVENEIWVPFQWRHDQYGRAEFHVCVKWKRGKVSEFWVYPVQTEMDTYWHMAPGDYSFFVTSYEGLAEPKVWRMIWCREHKAPSLHIYSPTYARYLQINRDGLSFFKNNLSGEAPFLMK